MAVATPARDIVSWEELDQLVGRLAEQVRGEYDVMLAITRGALVPAGRHGLRDARRQQSRQHGDPRSPGRVGGITGIAELQNFTAPPTVEA